MDSPLGMNRPEALGHALEAYEDGHGHASLRPRAPSARIQVATQGEHGPSHDVRTAHLRPVIDLLVAKGNRPSHGWPESGFWSNQGGELHYPSTVDAAELPPFSARWAYLGRWLTTSFA